jgi:hypothetical protein
MSTVATQSPPSSNEENRVADYFAVVGIDEELINECLVQYLLPSNTVFDISFETKILDFYPSSFSSSAASESSLTSESSSSTSFLDNIVAHSSITIPEGIEYFCFPDGIHFSFSCFSPENHSFIHTSESGTRLIGCCLIFYEEVSASLYEILESHGLIDSHHVGQSVFLPKAIVLISRYPFITAFEQFLSSLYHLSQSTTNTIPLERYICNFIDDVPAPHPG